MREISIREVVGAFAENKDKARDIRLHEILPALENHEDVVIDFAGVDAATQSFVHALISDLIRLRGIEVLNHVNFKNCNATIRKIIEIVVDYLQEGDL